MRAPQYPRFPATLGNIRPERDVSVSELTRAQKEILANTSATVPVTGQYYDLIRAGQQVQTSAPAALTNAYVRGVRNKAGGVKSFAAAGYNYPSGQMVIGAALAGAGTFMSPSEARKRQMAQLLGLGAGPKPFECRTTGYDCECKDDDYGCISRETLREGLKALYEQWQEMPAKARLKLIADAVDKIGGDIATLTVDGVKYKTSCVIRVLADRSDKLPKSCAEALNNFSASDATGATNVTKLALNLAKTLVKCLPAAIPVVLQSGIKCAVEAAAPADTGSGGGSSGGGMTLIRPTLRLPSFQPPLVQPPPPKSDGLSTGAMVGIGAAVVAVLGIGGYFLLRKKASAA